LDNQGEKARLPQVGRGSILGDEANTRLTIVQYAGDFREASQRLRGGGPETYRAQRHTVDYVEALAPRLAAVTTITCLTDAAYDAVLPSGARAVGAGMTGKVAASRLISLIEATDPTVMILRFPSFPVLRWAARRRIRTLLLLADSFDLRSLRGRARRLLLGHYARKPVFDVVANHGRNSARQLVEAGVPAEKVIAWDFPQVNRPSDLPAKTAPAGNSLIYVGALSPAKGIDDLLEAVALLAPAHPTLRLRVIGNDRDGRVATLARTLGIADRAVMSGTVPNAEIVPAMHAADIVVVPSRHDYPEGLPLTIYEAYCARTPLVASDHPMFTGNVADGESGLVFRAGDSADLARQVERLLQDSRLFARLSENAAAAWERLQLKVEWSELIDRWLEDSPESRRWLRASSLAAAG